MKFLYLLEMLRHACPPLAAAFGALTYLGDEAAFLAATLLVMWCVSKRSAYYLLTVGFLGTIVNQLLKVVCMVPRPWIRDPAFTVWEGAKGAATGYSFPSGHTQNAAGTYGTLSLLGFCRAHNRRGRILAASLGASLILTVAFSRMLLGVHTPADVLFSLGLGLFLTLALYPFFARERTNRAVCLLVSAMLAIALGFVLFLSLWDVPEAMDAQNFAEASKNAWTLLGAVGGVLTVSLVEPRCVRYETAAPLPAQIVKLLLGTALTLALKGGLKALFAMITLAPAMHALRYFLVVIFAGLIFPLTFPYLSRIGQKSPPARKASGSERAE